MPKAPVNMSVEEIEAELVKHEADNIKDSADKEAIRERQRARADRMTDLAAHREAKIKVAQLSDAERAALSQTIESAGGIASTAKVGTPGGK